jgi:small nuclear ribonucleoprotein (snRNP)-like protein
MFLTMGNIYRLSMLAVTSFILLAGFDGVVAAINSRPIDIAQDSGNRDEKVLEVALPESATVTLVAGESYTGELTAFDSTELTISVDSFSETFSLAQISNVEFQGEVWFTNSEGRRRRASIRGIVIPIEDVPVSALELSPSPDLATLDLENVLSDSEFIRLADEPRALKKIQLDSSEIMTVKIVGIRQ